MANIDAARVKGIIFDYGGTLDSGGDHWSEIIWAGYETSRVLVDKAEFREAYVYAERELARTLHILPHHDFRDMLGIKIKIEMQYLCQKGLMNPESVDEKSSEVADYCDQYARKSIAKIRPVLDKLNAQYPMVLVSNFYGNIESVLEKYHIRGYFNKIIESSVVGVRKPDPAIFRLGVEALDLPAEAVLVIGDSYKKDIMPAESIGCQVAWLKGKGWTQEENAFVHPNEMHELGDVLRFLALA